MNSLIALMMTLMKYTGYYGYNANGERVYKLTGTSVIDDEQASSATRRAIKSALRDQSITHATIEIEYGDDCPDREC